MIIGFCGPIGAGKTTAAKHFVDHHGYARIAFAKPLKDMCIAFGLSDREVNGDLKHSPSALICGKTPRQFMQYLGTEFGRDLIGPDLWVRAWRKAVLDHPFVVTDDVRFPNEVAAIHALGGKVIRIERPGMEPTSSHVSEQHELPTDYQVVNGGSETDFAAALDRLYSRRIGLGQAAGC